MTRPDILQVAPMMPIVGDQLAERFVVHRLWEAGDRDDFLAEHGARIRAIAAGAQIMVDGALMSRLPALEIVASLGVGYDNVDAEWAGAHGVVVTNTPDVLTDEVADFTVGLLIATLRQLPQAERYLRAGKWRDGPFPLTATLRERTVGILGLGRIGKAVATRLEAFGVPIVYHGRTRQSGVGYRYYDSLKAMAEDVDVLIAVAPGGAATEGLVGREVLEALGPDGVLINVGRGSVVDEPALIEALRTGKILSAGLDVFADEPNVPAELLAMDHVVLQPHGGSASVHTRNAMGQLVVDNLVAWFEGRGPLTPVKETPFERKG